MDATSGVEVSVSLVIPEWREDSLPGKTSRSVGGLVGVPNANVERTCRYIYNTLGAMPIYSMMTVCVASPIYSTHTNAVDTTWNTFFFQVHLHTKGTSRIY